MPILDSRSLRQKAANRLESAPNQGKLVLLFACVSAGLFLVTGLVSLLLDGLIAGTGGLGGLQKRSILTTVQAMLNLLLFVFVPFWNLGYISAALKLGHGEAAAETDLLNGFRRFGPALRLILLRLVVNFAVFFVAIQVASIVFSFTPWAQPFYQQLESQSLSDISAGLLFQEPLCLFLQVQKRAFVHFIAAFDHFSVKLLQQASFLCRTVFFIMLGH